MYDSDVTHLSYNDKIDVVLDGFRFRTIDRLNQYIQDERFFEVPDDLEVVNTCFI